MSNLGAGSVDDFSMLSLVTIVCLADWLSVMADSVELRKITVIEKVSDSYELDRVEEAKDNEESAILGEEDCPVLTTSPRLCLVIEARSEDVAILVARTVSVGDESSLAGSTEVSELEATFESKTIVGARVPLMAVDELESCTEVVIAGSDADNEE